MKVTAVDGVQVYELSAGKRLPHWLSDRKRRTLSKDAEISRRVDIIQDLEGKEVRKESCREKIFSKKESFEVAQGEY